jgi:aspartyl protease family protein
VSVRTATTLGLKRGAAIAVNTAGGPSTGYETRLERVSLGGIELRDVRAIIVEGMDDRMTLLGMTFLRRVEFSQRDGVLTLKSVSRP